MKIAHLITLVLFLTITFAHSQGGTPDSMFGADGLFVFNNNGNADNFSDMHILENDNLILGGYTLDSENQFPLICAVNSDGALMTSYADQGIFVLRDSAYNDGEVNGLTVYENETFVIYNIYSPDSSRGGMIKLDLNGTQIESFGSDGTKRFIYNSLEYFPRSIDIDNSGNAYVMGTRGKSFAVFKIDVNGNPIQSFGDNGVFRYEFEDGFANLRVLKLQPDGKVLIAGSNFIASASKTTMVIFRLTDAGVLDNGFNAEGFRVFEFNEGTSIEAQDIAVLETEDKILVTGSRYDTQHDGIVTRLNSDGSSDSSFGNGEMIIIEEVRQPLYAVLEDNQNRYVFAGDDYILRLNSSGELDNTFGEEGFINKVENIYAAGIDSDGNYIVAGSLYNGTDLDGMARKYFSDDVSSSSEDPYFSDLSFDVIPNPFNKNLSIELNSKNSTDNVLITISDMMGRMVFKSDPVLIRNGKFSLQLQNAIQSLPSQAYILSVLTPTSAQSIKVIKSQ